MALKDRFRRAISRTDRSSSNSSSSTTNPVSTTPTTTGPSSTPTPSNAPPSITLSKTSSRLSKTLTWTSRKNKAEEKEKKRLEDWEKRDQQEWQEPTTKHAGGKSKAHQDMLRAFELKFRERKSLDAGAGGRPEGGRRWSGWSMISGVSPGTSRMNSLEGESPRRTGSGARKRSGGGGLSREVTRTDSEGQGMVETVQEE